MRSILWILLPITLAYQEFKDMRPGIGITDENRLVSWGRHYHDYVKHGAIFYPNFKAVNRIECNLGLCCVLTADVQDLHCFSFNFVTPPDNGVFGTGDTTPISSNVMNITKRVAMPRKVADFAVGNEFACAIDSNQELYCWGDSGWNRIGIDTNEHTYSPMRVDFGLNPETNEPFNVLKVGIGHSTVCALLDNMGVKCWGSRYTNGFDRSYPNANTNLTEVPFIIGGDVEDMWVGEYRSCARLSDKSLKCWGGDDFGRVSVIDFGVKNADVTFDSPNEYVVSMDMSHKSVCYLSNKGNVKCFGYLSTELLESGELAVVNFTMPQVNLGENFFVKKLAFVFPNYCFLSIQGEAKCIGLGGFSNLGVEGDYNTIIGDSEDELPPKSIQDFPNPSNNPTGTPTENTSEEENDTSNATSSATTPLLGRIIFALGILTIW